MFDATIRAWKSSFWQPLARRMGWMHPSIMSLLAFGCGLACAWAAYTGHYALGLLLWLVNRVADGLDGELARASGRASDFGGYLDILLDVVIYALVPIGLAFAESESPRSGGLVPLLASFYLNSVSWAYLSAVLEKRQAAERGSTSVVMPAGLIAGTETVIFYSVFFVWPQYLEIGFNIMAVLVFVTVLQRLVWAYKWLSG